MQEGPDPARLRRLDEKIAELGKSGNAYLAILALVLVARKAAYPQALMKPYRKGER